MISGVEALHDCAHCQKTGICKSGPSGESCAICVQRNELKRGHYFGLSCGTCGGLGVTDTMTNRLTHRTQPILSIILVLASFFLVAFFGFLQNPYFHEILAFCTTTVGGVIGSYFSSTRRAQ